LLQVFDSLEKTPFVKKSMVHRDIEAAIRLRIEQTIDAILFHEARDFAFKIPNDKGAVGKVGLSG
jgi:hypothetical protein